MTNPEELFSLLSDETRLRILLLLHVEKELCVCELNHILRVIQPKISRHLALLKNSGLVVDDRRGQWVYYRFNDDLEEWIKQIISITYDEKKGVEPFCSDFQKRAKMPKESLC